LVFINLMMIFLVTLTCSKTRNWSLQKPRMHKHGHEYGWYEPTNTSNFWKIRHEYGTPNEGSVHPMPKTISLNAVYLSPLLDPQKLELCAVQLLLYCSKNKIKKRISQNFL